MRAIAEFGKRQHVVSVLNAQFHLLMTNILHVPGGDVIYHSEMALIVRNIILGRALMQYDSAKVWTATKADEKDFCDEPAGSESPGTPPGCVVVRIASVLCAVRRVTK